jgi:hypothetical protein
MKKKLSPILSNPYLPGIIMFFIALVIGFLTYKDYGNCWDEPYQRETGLLSYNYIFNHNMDLFTKKTDYHGAGFEILLVMLEKMMRLNDSRDIYLMRHIVSNIFFLIGVFAGYVLIYRLYKNRFLAGLGFFMLAFMPRIYAHSFYNTKDMPFLCVFIMVFAVCHIAFDKNKTWLFFALGLLCGYATSIRIMGVMLVPIIFTFFVADLIINRADKGKVVKTLLSAGAYCFGFIVLLYLPWPLLWRHPVHTFIEAYQKLSHYSAWKGGLLFQGKILYSDKPLPWTYFPTWFLITIPELWLAAGFGGIIWLFVDFFKRPQIYISNTPERNFILYLYCFFVPIFAVIFLKSVIYDDWRHLYFVYPPFIIIGIHFIHKLMQGKFQKIIAGACILQAAIVAFFMIQNHPFNEVYFNNLVSHDEESLRKTYDLEYWGCSFKQGLDHLVESDTSRDIKVCVEYMPMLDNNKMLLRPEDRKRIHFAMFDQADYYMSNFRLHPDDYPGTNIEYQIEVLNSTIFRIYKLRNTPAIKLR